MLRRGRPTHHTVRRVFLTDNKKALIAVIVLFVMLPMALALVSTSDWWMDEYAAAVRAQAMAAEFSFDID